MPVTIGTLRSTVTVGGNAGGRGDDAIERVVRRVLADVEDERRAREQSERERRIPDRMSDEAD